MTGRMIVCKIVRSLNRTEVYITELGQVPIGKLWLDAEHRPGAITHLRQIRHRLQWPTSPGAVSRTTPPVPFENHDPFLRTEKHLILAAQFSNSPWTGTIRAPVRI